MTLSLNEVEATAKKATRGAGYDWGMAEEAAKATRWLCSFGIDGCGALAYLLAQTDSVPLADHSPQNLDEIWQARATWLCPIMVGAALSDKCNLLNTKDVCLRYVACPIFVLPFAAMSARSLQSCLTMAVADHVFRTDGVAVDADLTQGVASIKKTSDIQIHLGGNVEKPINLTTRARPDPAAWISLNKFAARTYAPATEQSRRLGAGGKL